jgi:4-amino-4-deoxy-L-arabinose transferase-like glycosyltransferase
LPSAWRDRLNPPTRFLLAWVVPSWLLFEAVQTKLPHYVLPMFPALMLLGASWAMDPLRRMPPAWLRWVGLAAVAGVAAGLALLALVLPWRLGGGLLWGGPVALLGAAALVWLVLWLRRRGAWAGAVLAGCVLAVPIYLGVLEGVLPGVRAIWVSERLAATLHRAAPGLDPARFGVTGYAEPSLVFAVGTAAQLLRTGEEAAQFLAAEPGRVVAVGNRAEAAFQREAARLGLAAREIGLVTGLNYTRGRFLTLQLYRVAEAAP